MSRTTVRYLVLARRTAEKSDYVTRHGAVLVKGGSVLNCSFNKSGYSSFGDRFRETGLGPASLHAEIACVLGLDKSVTKGATIYVIRLGKRDDFRMSKPCPMCMEVIRFCGIRKIVYTVNDKSIAIATGF